MHVVALILGLSLFMLAFLLGGEPAHAFNLHTAYLVVGGALSFTYVAHRGALWQALAVGLFGKTADPETRAHSVHVLKTLRSAFMSVSIAFAIIGGIGMSRGLDDLATFGPAFAVLLLAPLYGVIFGELVIMTAMRRLEVERD